MSSCRAALHDHDSRHIRIDVLVFTVLFSLKTEFDEHLTKWLHLSSLAVRDTIPEGRRLLTCSLRWCKICCLAADRSAPKSVRTCLWYNLLLEDMYIENSWGGVGHGKLLDGRHMRCLHFLIHPCLCLYYSGWCQQWCPCCFRLWWDP